MAFISEIHYRNTAANNTGIDEYIEVTLSAAEMARDGDFVITLYQQNGTGTQFNLGDLTPVPHPDDPTGFFIYTLEERTTAPDHDPAPGRYNEFEGIALSDRGSVLSFFDLDGGSGSIHAVDGPAAGEYSETLSQPGGNDSIQFDISGNRMDGQINTGSSVICFARGTLVTTEHGEVAIEDLKPGDNVMTLDRGFQPIRWIGSRKLSNEELRANATLKPVQIRADALGPGLPKRDLFVSRQHRILLRSRIAERMFGSFEVMLPAIKLVDVPGISVVTDAEDVEYFHILFDQHEVIFANGTEAESLLTGPEALKAVSPKARAEITAVFPEIATGAFAAQTVRPRPSRGAQVRRFVGRHLRNQQPLVSAL